MNRLLLLPFVFVSMLLQAGNPGDFPVTSRYAFHMLADSLPPAINCPVSASYTLNPPDCDTLLNYTVVAYDNEPGFILTQTGGLPSGAGFPAGVHVNSFVVTDAAGNTAACSFSITVHDVGILLMCADQAIVELGDNCTAMPSWDLLVENLNIGCPDNFILEIDRTAPFGNGPWLPPAILAADINKTFAARVNQDVDGDGVVDQNEPKCFGNIMIKDKQGPDLVCEDITIPCEVAPVTPEFLFDSLGIVTAYPQISDNCGTVTDTSFISMLDFVDVYDPETQVLKFTRRIWSATDDSGNKSSCEQYIYQIKSNVSEIFFPADITMECSDSVNYTPEAAGLPYIELAGHTFPLNACAMVYTNVDSSGTACGNSERIFRTWYVLDSETSEERSGVQFIHIQDITPPVIACPAQVTYTVEADSCKGRVSLPNVEVYDACSGLSSFEARWLQNENVRVFGGTLQPFPGNEMEPNRKLGQLNEVVDFPTGTTSVTYLATDQCGNTGSCQWTITVLDSSPPVAFCDTIISIVLGPGGQTGVPAARLDAGSEDACLPLSFKVKMVLPGACVDHTAFRDSIVVCCADQADTLKAVLRVYDVELPAGIVSDTFAQGRFSDCTANIVVRDTLPPLCDNLPDITVSCAAFDPTFESFGNFSYSCMVDSFFTDIDYSLFDTTCRVGNITRTFNIVYESGQSAFCLQHLTFDPEEQHYYVRFPDDLLVTNCSFNDDYGKPEIYNEPGSCQAVDISFYDEIDLVVPNACYRIRRNWFVRNICHFDDALPLTMVPNPATVMGGPTISAPGTTGVWAPTAQFENIWSANSNGYFYTQQISVRDQMPPNIENCSAQPLVFQDSSNNNTQLWNESYWLDNDFQTNDLCEGSIDLGITAKDACNNEELDIQYLLFLDLNRDSIQETVVSSLNLPGYNTILYNNYQTPNYNGGTVRQFDERPVPPNQKWGFALQLERQDTMVHARLRFNSLLSPQLYVQPQLPYGTHKIRWIVEDRCGNERTCEQVFTIRDGKAPDITCPDSITVYFQDEPGVATVQLLEVLWSVADNCSPTSFVKTGLRLSGEGAGFPTDPAPQFLDFHCIPDANTTKTVEAWVKDAAGNTRFCDVVVQIDSCNLELPEQPNHIIGQVTTENELAIPDVSMLTYLSQDATNITLSDTTDLDGRYDISVDSATVGFQFVGGLASVHPYKNTNPLNGVTTYDLLLISRHILGLDTLDSPYKIIAADANKSGLISTFDVVEFRKLILGFYDNLPANTTWRFIPKDYVFPDPRHPFQPPFPESDTSFYFLNGGTFDFIGLKVGDVDLSVNPQNAQGELSERRDQVLPVQTHEQVVTEGAEFTANFSTQQASLGFQFTMSYEGLELLEILPEKGVSPDQFAHFAEKNAFTVACEHTEPVAFSVRFRALRSDLLSKMLTTNSRITPAAAWLPGSGKSAIPAQVALAFTDVQGFALLQNQPNPFSGKTVIRFQLPVATEATVKVFDGNGRILFSQSGNYEKGIHHLPVDLQEVPAGVLYYQLETPEYRAVGKMVVGY